MNVTALEEVMHVFYGHKPSQMHTESSSIARTEYDEKAEQEAYWTAAAVLLPAKAVARAVWQQVPAAKLAMQYGISVELAEMRIKVLGLWKLYLASQANGKDK